MDLIWGAGVAATDGWAGSLAGVLAAPDGSITHLTVKRGLAFTKRMQVPVEHVRRWDQDGIYLDLTILEILRFPRTEPAAVSLTRATRVRLSDGAALRLAGLHLRNGSPHHLIVKRPFSVSEPILLSVEHVTSLDAGGASAALGKQDLKDLAEYRRGPDIESDFWEALYTSEGVSDVDLKSITARGSADTMVLEGNVRTAAASAEAERLAGSIAGVSQVENRIVSDWDVDMAAAAHVSQEAPHLAAFITFHTQLGEVQVEGRAPSEEERDALLRGIRALPGVRGVDDLIAVEPTAFAEPAPAGGQPEEARPAGQLDDVVTD